MSRWATRTRSHSMSGSAFASSNAKKTTTNGLSRPMPSSCRRTFGPCPTTPTPPPQKVSKPASFRRRWRLPSEAEYRWLWYFLGRREWLLCVVFNPLRPVAVNLRTAAVFCLDAKSLEFWVMSGTSYHWGDKMSVFFKVNITWTIGYFILTGTFLYVVTNDALRVAMRFKKRERIHVHYYHWSIIVSHNLWEIRTLAVSWH